MVCSGVTPIVTLLTVLNGRQSYAGITVTHKVSSDQPSP